MSHFIVYFVEALPQVLFVAAVSQSHLFHHVLLVMLDHVVPPTHDLVNQILFDLTVCLLLEIFHKADVVLVRVLEPDTCTTLLLCLLTRLK